MILRKLLPRKYRFGDTRRYFSLFNSGQSEEGTQTYASIWSLRAETATKTLKLGTEKDILESLKRLRGLRFGFKMSDKTT